MNPPARLIHCWPEIPALPPVGQPSLVRVPVTGSRSLARREIRAALRRVLVDWSGLSPEQLPLYEMSRGPVWPGLLAGHSLDLSLSYEAAAGWIGFVRGASIGIDALRPGPFAEMEEVARHYLSPAALTAINSAADPSHAFALAWTGLEARLKCEKRGLTERSPGLEAAIAGRWNQTAHFSNGAVLSVVTASAGNPTANH